MQMKCPLPDRRRTHAARSFERRAAGRKASAADHQQRALIIHQGRTPLIQVTMKPGTNHRAALALRRWSNRSEGLAG